MDLLYGINGAISARAARPVTVESSTPIGIVATVDAGVTGFKKFNNAEEGLAYVKENNITDGTLKASLTGIYLQGVNCPIVCYLVAKSVDDAIPQILEAIGELTKSEYPTGISLRLGLIIVPEFSADVTVAGKIDSIATRLWATGISDDFSIDEAGFKNYMENFGSRFMLHTTGYTQADGMGVPNSSIIAGVIVRFDAEPFGWAKSHSNRLVLGAAGTSREVEYFEGSDCEARRLRQEGACLVLKDIGWRTYGFETRDIDPIWQALDRVRTFYRVLDALIKANKWARDREADQLLEVKKTITQFMNELIGNGVAIGFRVYFDTKKNTKATVTAGKFYLTVEFQDMPSIKELNLELVYVDDYSDVLINFLNQGE
jgi:uncharacterized protein